MTQPLRLDPALLRARLRQAIPGPYWYLQALGVVPAVQGWGIGGSLLQPVLARADAAGLPCYLETETERNVAFYRKHGFEELTEEGVAGSDLRMWTMSRQAGDGPPDVAT